MKTIEIRKCRKNEIDITADLYIRTVDEMIGTGTNYPKWRRDYPDRQSVISAFESGSQYICLADGVIAGAFVLNEDPAGAYEKGDWEKTLSRGEYLIIHTLAVSSSFRGMGIGAGMTEFCIETAESGGYKAVRLDIVPENLPAEKLYRKMGFKFAGQKDLERGIDDIPEFKLFEYNLPGDNDLSVDTRTSQLRVSEQ